MATTVDDGTLDDDDKDDSTRALAFFQQRFHVTRSLIVVPFSDAMMNQSTLSAILVWRSDVVPTGVEDDENGPARYGIVGTATRSGASGHPFLEGSAGVPRLGQEGIDPCGVGLEVRRPITPFRRGWRRNRTPRIGMRRWFSRSGQVP